MLARMSGFRLGWILVVLGVFSAACRDNDDLPNEPSRQMDGGLHMPQRDAATSDAADDDAGEDDGGNGDAGQ